MILDFENDKQKRENAAAFINATDKLLTELGTKNISIRKIAKEADFHSSTIYLYFEDLDQLILLATMRYFESYEKALAEYSKQSMSDPYEYFLDIWNLFMESAFEHPFTFQSFFFGKHSNALDKIIDLYYRIFPEKKRTYSGIIQRMFAGRNLHERNLSILEPLCGLPGYFPAEKLTLINNIIVSCFKDYLEQICNESGREDLIQISKNEMLEIIEYVVKV